MAQIKVDLIPPFCWSLSQEASHGLEAARSSGSATPPELRSLGEPKNGLWITKTNNIGNLMIMGYVPHLRNTRALPPEIPGLMTEQ